MSRSGGSTFKRCGTWPAGQAGRPAAPRRGRLHDRAMAGGLADRPSLRPLTRRSYHTYTSVLPDLARATAEAVAAQILKAARTPPASPWPHAPAA